MGVGVSYAFTTTAGPRAAVLIHLNRRRDTVIYGTDDPEQVLDTLVLNAAESRAVAELLDLPVVVDQVTDLPQALDGVEPCGYRYLPARRTSLRRLAASVTAIYAASTT